LYIKTELLTSIPNSLGLTVFLDIFRVALPVILQVPRILTKPFFDPRIVISMVGGILLPPSLIVL
jgi:hypothetical protein